HLFIPPGDVADPLPRGTPTLRDRGQHPFSPQQALDSVSGTRGVLFVPTRLSPQSTLGRPGGIVPLRDEVDSHEWSARRFSAAPLEPSPQLPSDSIGQLFYTQQAIQPPGTAELRPVLGPREYPQVFTREPPPHEEAMQLPRGVPGGEGGDIQPLRRRVQIHTRGQVCVTSRSGRELNIEPAGEPVGVAPHPAEPCRDIRRFQLRHIPQAGESEPLP